MERDELLKLNKDKLVEKVLELQATEVGQAIAQRDDAYAKQGEQATRITDLEVELNKKAEELAAVQATLEEIQAKLPDADTVEEINELSRQVADLSARLAATEATKGDRRPVVKVRGQLKLVTMPRIRLRDGRVITAEELMADQKLLEELVDAGSSALKDIPTK